MGIVTVEIEGAIGNLKNLDVISARNASVCIEKERKEREEQLEN